MRHNLRQNNTLWDKIKYFGIQKRLNEYPDCTQPAGGEEDCLMLDIYQVCTIT